MLAANTISNTGKFAKMVHPDMKMVLEVVITLPQKINDYRQQAMIKILPIGMANHPLYLTLSPILSVLLLLQPSANTYRCTASKALSTKVNKEPPLGLERRSQRFNTSPIVWLATRTIFFFFYLGFLSRTFTIHKTAGEGGGYLFNSSLPLPPAYRLLDISRVITAGSSPLRIAGSGTQTGNLWFPSASH